MEKVLIIRFSSIGDIVLTSPVVRCLKLQKGVEIHFLTKKSHVPVLSASPYIDYIHSFANDLKEVAEELKRQNFDLIIDLHKNLRSFQVRRHLKKRSISFDKGNLLKWLMVQLKVKGMKVDHIVRRYMKSMEKIGVIYDGEGLDYFLLPQGRHFPEVEFPYVCFGIGGTHATKRMPPSMIKDICQALEATVYLLGGQEDVEAGQEIAANLPHVKNLCGALSISDSSRLIKDASAVITHDTAIMHIAAAFNRRIFSIWGNTVPEFGMFPFYPEHDSNRFNIAQVSGLSCRPCSKIGFKSCPKGHFRCMVEQDTKHIAELVRIELSNK